MKKTAADSGKILLDAQKIETQCAFAPIADARFNIFYVLSNGGGVYIDGDWFEFEEDMLFLTMPDNLYRFDTDGAQLFRVRFSLGAADERWLAPLACDPDSSVFYISGEDVGVFRTFLNEFGSDTVEYDRLMLDAVLAKLAASCEPFGENSTAKRARLYMRSNFRRALTLEECAEYAALAPTYFSEVFKKETGTNFKKSLSSVRLEFAKKLLLYTDTPTATVCERCGFGDYANFIRVFGQYFGASPTLFRKNANK